jgi:hypothetical protein
MSATGCVIKQLSAALDRLKESRAVDKDYFAASEQVLAEMEKLSCIGASAPLDLVSLYQKLTQEFLYAEKCAELRIFCHVGTTGSQTSKY